MIIHTPKTKTGIILDKTQKVLSTILQILKIITPFIKSKRK